MRGHLDLERATAVAVVGAVLAIAVPWELVRIVVGLPLALFLPGYAISAAVFARAEVNRPQEAMAALALSLAVLALGGLLLTYVPGGIGTASWAVLLLLVVIGACRAAALRRPRGRRGRGGRRFGAPKLGNLAAADVAGGVIAAALVVGALVLALTPLTAGKAAGYTALWMVPGNGEDAGRLLVGVESSEQEPRRYRLEVHSLRLGREVQFELAPGGERVASLPLPASGPKERVEATLYRLDRPGVVYRKVALWVPKGAGG
jgi:uncharacterized membrane protein